MINLNLILRRRIIDLKNESISKNWAADSLKQKGHCEELQSDIVIQELHQLNLNTNASGEFLSGDYMTEEQLNVWIQQSQDNDASVLPVRTLHCHTFTQSLPAKRYMRNESILTPLTLLINYNHSGSNLKLNINLKLQNDNSMRIIQIVQNTSTSAI